MDKESLICQLCGKEEQLNVYGNANTMRHYCLCFTCNFWRERKELDKSCEPYTVVVAKGVHYIIGDENEKGCRGFGGAKVKVIFNDGTEKLTTNLWCQGDIPEHFKSDFPDNAKLIWG